MDANPSAIIPSYSMKLDKAPTESYADIGGLEQQIQEIKVRAFPSTVDCLSSISAIGNGSK